MPDPSPQPQPLQIAYVVTTTGHDAYAPMTLISASLARRVHPHARIIILCDDLSEAPLARHARALLDLADQVKGVKTGFTDPARRNRCVKTQMRQLIDGDFIYLDGDTLPIRPFADACRGDFAAALDRCIGSRRSRFPAWAVDHYKAMGWPHPTRRYYNGGVMFMRDNPVMRRFGHEWHRRWRGLVAQGAYQDQPSLNSALDAIGPDARVLPTRFNAMVAVDPLFAFRARIFHYYAAGTHGTPDPSTVFARLLARLQSTGKIDWPLVELTARTRQPFLTPQGGPVRQLILGQFKSAWNMIRNPKTA